MNYNTVSGLTKLKDKFNELISERIMEAKHNNAVEKINECGIGELKYIFESLSDKLYNSKNGKKIIKEYVNTVTSDKGLTNFYTSFEMVKNANGVNNPEIFLKEAISFKKNISESSIDKLKDVIKKTIKEAKLDDDEVETLNENYNNSVESKLSYILSENKTKKNLVEFSNNMSIVCESINKNTNEKVITNVDEAINGINDVMNESDESNKKIIKDITLYTASGKGRKTMFEDYKKMCSNTIKETLEDCESVQDKNRFQTMLENLENKKYSSENFIVDIIKLNELNETLKNN